MPRRNLPTDAAGEPRGKAQRNRRWAAGFASTDPDSPILKGGVGWIQRYNCQAAVDGDHQVIVAVGFSNDRGAGIAGLLTVIGALLSRLETRRCSCADPPT
jgi:hypothetical protein